MAEKTVHHGRNIKRIREIQGVKQEALALELGDDWNQKKISLLESKEMIDDELLVQVANALHVTPEAIKKFNEEAAFNIISNNNFENCEQPASIFYNSTINPIDKWMEALEENRKLYERLLQSEREKVELLEKVLELKK
jgi:transcriptional regulator with XRE-family HTH domain